MTPRLAIILAALAAVVGLYWLHERHAARVVDQAVQADRRVWQAEAERFRREADQRTLDAETRAGLALLENTHAQELARQRLAADVARLRADGDSLRDTIAALLGGGGFSAEGAPSLSLVDAARPLAVALSECSREYEAVAETADRLALQVTGLQGYVRDVVGPVCVAARQ